MDEKKAQSSQKEWAQLKWLLPFVPGAGLVTQESDWTDDMLRALSQTMLLQQEVKQDVKGLAQIQRAFDAGPHEKESELALQEMMVHTWRAVAQRSTHSHKCRRHSSSSDDDGDDVKVQESMRPARELIFKTWMVGELTNSMTLRMDPKTIYDQTIRIWQHQDKKDPWLVNSTKLAVAHWRKLIQTAMQFLPNNTTQETDWTQVWATLTVTIEPFRAKITSNDALQLLAQCLEPRVVADQTKPKPKANALVQAVYREHALLVGAALQRLDALLALIAEFATNPPKKPNLEIPTLQKPKYGEPCRHNEQAGEDDDRCDQCMNEYKQVWAAWSDTAVPLEIASFVQRVSFELVAIRGLRSKLTVGGIPWGMLLCFATGLPIVESHMNKYLERACQTVRTQLKEIATRQAPTAVELATRALLLSFQ